MDAAEALLGGPVLPSLPEGVLYFAEAGWHDDDGIGVTGRQVRHVLRRRSTPAHGALRFVAVLAIRRWRPPEPAGVPARRLRPDSPGVAVASRPEDVIAFDLHTFHASFGGQRPLGLDDRVPRPPLKTKRPGHKTLRWVDGAFEQAFRGFDRERYPAWRDWLENPIGDRRRATVIGRLRATGVLARPGSDVGW